MTFPIRTCAVCGEDFELRPDKPGFANRCLDCTVEAQEAATGKQKLNADERKSNAEANEARRSAIRNLLYTKDS